MGGEAMSTAEVAHELRCSARWVCELIRRGDIPARRIGARTWAVHRDDLRRYIERKAKKEVAQKA